MARQIVDSDLQCGRLDWRPTLQNRKKYLQRCHDGPNRN